MSTPRGTGNTTPFLRGPRKDTQPYHPDAPKRGTSFASGQRGDQTQMEQDVAVGGATSNTTNTLRPETGNAANAQLFSQIAWGVKEGESQENINYDDYPSPPSRDGSTDSPPFGIASKGLAAPPKQLYGTAPGGYVTEPNVLVVASEVNEDEQRMNYLDHPFAMEYDPESKPKIHDNRHHWKVLTGFCCFMLVGVAGIVSALIIQSSKGSSHDSGTESPTSAPSTNMEAAFKKLLSSAVGDGVYDENTYLERAANWIMFEDPLALNSSDPTVVQRYLLAVFYFSTTDNLSQEWGSCNAPMSTDTANCSFQLLFRQEGDTLTFQDVPSMRWLSGESECIWAGVTCDQGHVVGIELGKFKEWEDPSASAQFVLTFPFFALSQAGQNLTGTLVSELAALPYLQSLAFHYNEFSGSIPVEYAGMRYMVNLELHGNQLSGTIPSELYKVDIMQQLNVAENMLTGTVSTWVGQLTNLKGLHVGNNYLEGSIPTEIGLLKFLTHSRWDHNMFVGTMPSEIAQLTSLQELWLQGNTLTGRLPSQLSALTSLEDLQLYENQFNGTIPEEFYDMLGLLRLELSNNALTGTLSTGIGRLQQLTDFRVARNKLVGTIPTQLSSLTNLRIVWMHINQFDGEVPDLICNIVGKGFLEYLNADCGPDENPANPCACCTGCCDRSTEICLLTKSVISN